MKKLKFILSLVLTFLLLLTSCTSKTKELNEKSDLSSNQSAEEKVDDVIINNMTKYNNDRNEIMNEIFAQHKPSGKNPDFTEKYNENVYKFADALAKEKNSNGKWTIANDGAKWMNLVQMLDPEYRDDYIRGKSIMATFDDAKKARLAMLMDDMISDEVKVMLATESTAEKYTIFLKHHNVPASMWLSVKNKYDTVKSIEVPGGADITKKQQVCDYINSLKISNDEKSALYRACGYEDASVFSLEYVNWQYVYDDGTTTTKHLNQRAESYVYVTKTGSKFHSSWCYYLNSTVFYMLRQDAINSGYTPCSRCYP